MTLFKKMTLFKRISLISNLILILTLLISSLFILLPFFQSSIEYEKSAAMKELNEFQVPFEEHLSELEANSSWAVPNLSNVVYAFERVAPANAVLMYKGMILNSNQTFNPQHYLLLDSNSRILEPQSYYGLIDGNPKLLIGTTITSNLGNYSIYLVTNIIKTYNTIFYLIMMILLIISITTTLSTWYLNTAANTIEQNIQDLQTQIEHQKLFMGAISHEYKTPLTGMLLHLDLLNTIEMDPETTERSLQHLTAQCTYLQNVTQKLTQLITLDKAISLQSVALPSFIEELTTNTETLLHSKNIKLTVEYSNNSNTTLVFDPLLMQVALKNLIVNACNASTANATIHLRLNNNIWEVEDYGCGISEADCEHILEPFYVVDKSRNKTSSGTGIGLALVNEIVTLHQGTLAIHSELGQGTRIIITLPKGAMEHEKN